MKDFGLWSGIIPEHVTTRKAQRRTQEGGRRGHHTDCARLARTIQSGQDSWMSDCVRGVP